MASETSRTLRTPPIKCQACQRPMESPLFCDYCRSLYPADGLDYFQLLGFKPSFDVDEAELRQRYLQMSHDVHPDRHGGTLDTALSLRVSAQLNEAYRVLADPVLRAEYLLEVCGGRSAAEEKSVPQEVLATALALREELEEARELGEQAAFDACAVRARRMRDDALATIATLARQLPGDEPIRQQLRTALNSVKYYQRLLEAV